MYGRMLDCFVGIFFDNFRKSIINLVKLKWFYFGCYFFNFGGGEGNEVWIVVYKVDLVLICCNCNDIFG